MDNHDINESGFTKGFLQGLYQNFLMTISCHQIGGKASLHINNLLEVKKGINSHHFTTAGENWWRYVLKSVLLINYVGE